MLGLVRSARAAATSARHVVAVGALLAVAATIPFLPGRTAHAFPRSDHASVPAMWGHHLRPTPNFTPPPLPPMSHNLQPVPLPGGRVVLLHLPPRSNLAHPLIFALHGLSNTAASMLRASGFDSLADRQGYIIAYGVGVDGSWDAGTCCGDALKTHVDDVAYLADAVTAISAHFAVDQSRILVTGFSNGGMMAFRAACERPDLFRAALSVAGPLVARCPHPITVIHVQGTLDPTVPLVGGYSTFARTSFPDSRTESHRLPRGSHERLVLWRGGHHWPKPVYGVDIDQLLEQLVG